MIIIIDVISRKIRRSRLGRREKKEKHEYKGRWIPGVNTVTAEIYHIGKEQMRKGVTKNVHKGSETVVWSGEERIKDAAVL